MIQIVKMKHGFDFFTFFIFIQSTYKYWAVAVVGACQVTGLLCAILKLAFTVFRLHCNNTKNIAILLMPLLKPFFIVIALVNKVT